MRISFKAILSMVCLLLISSALPIENEKSIEYPKLHEFIQRTLFVDVHCHPLPGHMKYHGRDRYPDLQPYISWPFWPIKKDRIALVDSLQAGALQAIYGYRKRDVTDEDIPELEKLSLRFWEAGNKKSFNRALDACGIDKILANSNLPKKDLDQSRVLWVPFVDSLLYPLDPSDLKSITPELKNALLRYFEENKKLAQKFKAKPQSLQSYLEFLDTVLGDYKQKGAAALKVASAYIRTLWFDRVEEEEAREIFDEAQEKKILSWTRYKKLQDFIARYIFFNAGELDLPVHFHTGFGATATLKNLDSSPMNLESVFSDMKFKKSRFVMLHAGYPYWDKLKPLLEKKNVFVEFSAVNWMVYEHELAEIIYQWLSYHGLAEKPMFGSDAGTPVFFWIAAENSRLAIYRALARLIEERIIDEEKAILLARKIMRDNAIYVHNLKN